MRWARTQTWDVILAPVISYRTITQLSNCSGRWLMTVVFNNGVINWADNPPASPLTLPNPTASWVAPPAKCQPSLACLFMWQVCKLESLPVLAVRLVLSGVVRWISKHWWRALVLPLSVTNCHFCVCWQLQKRPFRALKLGCNRLWKRFLSTCIAIPQGPSEGKRTSNVWIKSGLFHMSSSLLLLSAPLNCTCCAV